MNAEPLTPKKPTDTQEVLVRVEGVSKKFCRDLKQSLWYGVKDVLHELNPLATVASQSTLRPGEFWANNDISFEVRRGECLGLIGHNGAGKTTLLKMLNGLIKPDAGRIEMRGKVAALIALGAGFNPVLTGRENIYVNAAVLGISKKEVAKKFDEIVEFAEIGDFIDAPVQSYSSGMQVRLGFSIATALDPDVLILDEVLAVGDVKFREKSLRRVKELMKRSAVIFVSHNAEQLRMICQTGLILQKGEVVARGEINRCMELYYDMQIAVAKDPVSSAGGEVYPLRVTELEVRGPQSVIYENDHVRLILGIEADMAFEDSIVSVVIYSQTLGMRITSVVRGMNECGVSIPAGRSCLEVDIDDLALSTGEYRLEVYFLDKERVIVSRNGTHGLLGLFKVCSREIWNVHREFGEPSALTASIRMIEP